MSVLIRVLVFAATAAASGDGATQPLASSGKQAIVLMLGNFDECASWREVITASNCCFSFLFRHRLFVALLRWRKPQFA